MKEAQRILNLVKCYPILDPLILRVRIIASSSEG
jgi:hypothetical protein